MAGWERLLVSTAACRARSGRPGGTGRDVTSDGVGVRARSQGADGPDAGAVDVLGRCAAGRRAGGVVARGSGRAGSLLLAAGHRVAPAAGPSLRGRRPPGRAGLVGSAAALPAAGSPAAGTAVRTRPRSCSRYVPVPASVESDSGTRREHERPRACARKTCTQISANLYYGGHPVSCPVSTPGSGSGLLIFVEDGLEGAVGGWVVGRFSCQQRQMTCAQVSAVTDHAVVELVSRH
jgi:hypothetical protein